MHGTVSTTEVFLLALLALLALLVIFSLPYLVWRLTRVDYYAPLVVMQIIGGVAIGPGVLGAAFPDYYAFIFRPEVVAALNGIAWWGVMIFVWIAGLELDLKHAWRCRFETGVTAGLALIVPLIFGCAAGAAALLLLASVAGKLLGLSLAGKILKWPKGEASLIGWLLQTKALIMIIFANILLDREIISSDTFTALLLMAIASTMLTVPLVTPKLRRLLGQASGNTLPSR